MLGDQLIMELTMEQGPGRETQVQPPINVWVRFFEIDFAQLPTLRLKNRQQKAPTEVRPVVEHDHNWTVEVVGAVLPRPAIVRFARTANNRYDYWIYRPGEAPYAHCRWILDTFANPYRKKGRKWMII